MSFDNYFDTAGLLVNKLNPATPDGDGGDSAQMMGLYRFGRYMKQRASKNDIAMDRDQARFASELDILTYTEGHGNVDTTGAIHKQVSYPGIYVRHPKPCSPDWAANPRTFSRDQQRSLVVAMGALKQKKKLFRIFWEHIKRGGFYQNNQEIDGSKKLADFAAPDILGEYIRAFWMAGILPVLILWPLLLLTDVSALVGLVISLIKWKRHPEDVDDDNQILTVLQAKVALPTPISWLTRKLYKHLRPGGAVNAVTIKHRAETGSPPFAELYTDILNKEL